MQHRNLVSVLSECKVEINIQKKLLTQFGPFLEKSGFDLLYHFIGYTNCDYQNSSDYGVISRSNEVMCNLKPRNHWWIRNRFKNIFSRIWFDKWSFSWIFLCDSFKKICWCLCRFQKLEFRVLEVLTGYLSYLGFQPQITWVTRGRDSWACPVGEFEILS